MGDGNTLNGGSEVGGRAHDAGNSRRDTTIPVRPHNHVETGLGAVLQSELGNLIGASIIYRKRPKAVTKVGRLNNGLLLKRKITKAVDHVLVRVSNEFLGGIGVIVQHCELIDRRNAHGVIKQKWLRNLRELVPLLYT